MEKNGSVEELASGSVFNAVGAETRVGVRGHASGLGGSQRLRIETPRRCMLFHAPPHFFLTYIRFEILISFWGGFERRAGAQREGALVEGRTSKLGCNFRSGLRCKVSDDGRGAVTSLGRGSKSMEEVGGTNQGSGARL